MTHFQNKSFSVAMPGNKGNWPWPEPGKPPRCRECKFFNPRGFILSDSLEWGGCEHPVKHEYVLASDNAYSMDEVRADFGCILGER